MRIYYLFALSVFSWFYTQGQTTLQINGSNLKINESAILVLKNAQFINNGNFDAGTGAVIITGNGPDAASAIGGTSSTTFYNLQINKSNNGSQLQQTIQVDHELKMTSGNLDLNGNDLILGEDNGIIIDESETSRISGTNGGEISKTLDLNAPTAINPGNIGVVLTSEKDLGPTTIKRGHIPEPIAGSEGIERYYEITPTNNTELNATAQFQYLDAELNSIREEDLGTWRQDDTFWFNPKAIDANTTTNFVETTSINFFSRWTLALDAPKISIRVFLQGSYSTTNLDMNDDLRSNDLVPTIEPYAGLGYDHVSSGSGESVVDALLDIATADAIVDWVFVELRDATDNTVVVAARSALLQKDGDIVDLDGISPLSFPGIAKGGSYYIAVHHRNHLGVMTANTISLN